MSFTRCILLALAFIVAGHARSGVVLDAGESVLRFFFYLFRDGRVELLRGLLIAAALGAVMMAPLTNVRRTAV